MAVEKIKAGTGKEEAKPLCTLQADELLSLNEGCSMLKLAKNAVDRTWDSIRNKYKLPTEKAIYYDRATGVVAAAPTDG